MYDLTDRAGSTLESVTAPGDEIRQPSIAGDTVAWIHRTQSVSEIVTLDLVTGQRRTFGVADDIYTCALSADSRYLAWDEGYAVKRVRDLRSGSVLQYAAQEGWGTQRAGSRFSWQPATQAGGNGRAGFYDAVTNEVRFVKPASVSSYIISGGVLGNWFFWQDRDPASDNFYFIRVQDESAP